MRALAAVLITSMAVLVAPARATDTLPPAGAPLGDDALAVARGGAAASAIAAGGDTLSLTSTSSLQASVAHSPAHLPGAFATGDITVGDISAAGGITALQLSTGVNNVQQIGVAQSFSF